MGVHQSKMNDERCKNWKRYFRVSENGYQYWYIRKNIFCNEYLHRDDDMPAVINSNGRGVAWYKYGKKHRLNAPAFVDDNGRGVAWFEYGKLHRIDGPALIDENGDEFWYQYDKAHRLDGPAIIRKNGEEIWFVNGKYLRN